MIELQKVRFSYPDTAFQLEIDELAIRSEERVGIVGTSGSGKTTLLHLIAGIQDPESGTVSIDGRSLFDMSERQRRDFRISHIGLVFQTFELLDYLPVRENILLPYYINHTIELTEADKKRMKEVAGTTGIRPLLDRLPGQLSQGERQRVAICRALVTSPSVVLADEPTGNLDPDTGERVMNLLVDQISSREGTLVVASHDPALMDSMDRVIDLERMRSSADAARED